MIKVRKHILTAVSIILFLLVSPIHMVRNLWEGLISNQPRVEGISWIEEAYAVTLASVEEALKSFMPDADSIENELKVLTEAQKKSISASGKIVFDPDLGSEFHFYIGKSNGQIIGYAVDDYVKGKWGLIHHMVYLDPTGVVQAVMVLEYGEKRGRPVAKKRFLKQFKGKSVSNKIKLNKDIKGVTGASISSRGMTNGVRKIVHVFNELYLQGK